MTTRPAGNGQIVREKDARAVPPETSMIQWIEKHAQDFALVLPKHLTPERMVRLAVSAVRTTPKLAECPIATVASSLMACATLGLEPNTPMGLAYLIPRRNKRHGNKQECTLLVGYQGLKELMYSSGYVSSVKAREVYEGDLFE